MLIGVLIGGVFFFSTQEARIANGAMTQERAFRAAELGLNTAVSKWDNAAMSGLATGAVVTQVYDSSAQGWVDTVRITKVNQTTFNLVSSATAGSGTRGYARKRTGLTVRIATADFKFLGALTVRGATKIGGSSYITGFDSNPSTWSDCPAPSDTMPGIAIASQSDITTAGCSDFSCVYGSPKILQDPAAADTSTYFKFGDFDWASLTAMATKTYDGSPTITGPASVTTGGGLCDMSVLSNWGSPIHTNPAGPCENYFPIIYSRGTTNIFKITGGRGQGILLVDGDLEISGGFEFYGPVVVRGRLKSTGNGTIHGGVMAANVDLEQNTVLGNATVEYSNCGITKAVAAAGSAWRVTQRAWMDVY